MPQEGQGPQRHAHRSGIITKLHPELRRQGLRSGWVQRLVRSVLQRHVHCRRLRLLGWDRVVRQRVRDPMHRVRGAPPDHLRLLYERRILLRFQRVLLWHLLSPECW